MEYQLNDEAVAQVEGAQRMAAVIREMKEIPELPSEAPKDVQGLEKVEFPPAGGVLTYMKGNEHPYHGFPYFEFVEKIDAIKKLSRGILSGLFHELKSVNKIWLITLLPALWFFKPLVYAALYSFHRLVVRSRVKSSRYSVAVREIHRAFEADDFSKTLDGKTRHLKVMLRDLVCMILEFDNAYRFRFQDALVKLDKKALENNPIKELDRILVSMQSRELGQDIKDTWTLLRLFCKLYLRFDKRLQMVVKDFLLKLDLEKIKLSDDDKFYCPFRKDFQPRFLKGLKETPVKKLTKVQKHDRFIIEKAYLSKLLSEEKTQLVDSFNTEAAKLKDNHKKQKEKLEGELNAIKNSLKELENNLNAEATRLATATNATLERIKDKPEYPDTQKALNELLNQDVLALQARFNTEANKQNEVTQKKVNELASVEAEFKKKGDVLEKKYNRLADINKATYPKKVKELKTLCQQQNTSSKKDLRRLISKSSSKKARPLRSGHLQPQPESLLQTLPSQTIRLEPSPSTGVTKDQK